MKQLISNGGIVAACDSCKVAKIMINRSSFMIIVTLLAAQIALDTSATIGLNKQWLGLLPLSLFQLNHLFLPAAANAIVADGSTPGEPKGWPVKYDNNADSSSSSNNNKNNGQLAFIDSSCERMRADIPLADDSEPGRQRRHIERLLMIFRCDVKPLVSIFERLISSELGRELRLFSADDLSKLNGLVSSDDKSMGIWREYLSMSSLIEHFYSEARHVLSHMDFCSYSTIHRLSKLKPYVLGSKLLSHLFDLLAIEYHSTCLEKALSRLPAVPYLVREVVGIYRSQADKSVLDLNADASDEEAEVDSVDGVLAEPQSFDVDEAIARHGPLTEVMPLLLLMPSSGAGSSAQEFRRACRGFRMDIEERWQSVKMMSQMLNTANNGIKSFSDLVQRTLVPMKFADVCGQLSAKA